METQSHGSQKEIAGLQKEAKKMFKKSVVLVVLMVMLFSFSAAIIAEDGTLEGQAPNNKAGGEILVENEDGETEIHFMDAVNENAKDEEKGNETRPTNPILVAGD